MSKPTRKTLSEEELRQVLAKKYPVWSKHIFNRNEYVADAEGNLHKTTKQEKSTWQFIRKVSDLHSTNNERYDIAEYRHTTSGETRFAIRRFRLKADGTPTMVSATTKQGLSNKKLMLPTGVQGVNFLNAIEGGTTETPSS